MWLASHRRTESFQVPSSNLVDLEVVADDAAPKQFRHSPHISAPSPELPSLEPEKDTPQEPFVDPAILSIGKPPVRLLKKTDTFATLSEPFGNLTLESNRPETSELETTELATAFGNVRSITKTRRSTKVKKAKAQRQSVDNSSIQQTNYSEEPRETQSSGKKGNGGRARGRKPPPSAPAEVDSLGITKTASVQTERKSLSSRKQRHKLPENQNGWATEDATDIQELGDFDFAANLSKFNKREVFRQLKEDDTVDESARLVGHNRVPRAGTGGGRNLHWTENVLDTPKATNNGMWNSEAGDTADEIHEPLSNSGRSSRREASRSRTRVMPSSRKGSTRTIDDLSSIRASSRIGSFRQTSYEATDSPRIKTRIASSTSPYIGSTSMSRPSLRLQGSNKVCPCLTPWQALEFEQYAVTELGLSEDMVSENAARGVAETLAKVVESEKENSKLPTTIVAIAGNHKTGARTLAACRHLRNRGVRVVATVMHFGHDEDLLEPVRRQTNAFLKAGGLLARPNELLENLKSGSIKPDIFLDALLAAHSNFEDLRRNEQAWCFEIVILMNRMIAKVASIDVPSGIDPSSGEVTMSEGSALAISPHMIISLGAPKPYLLAMLRGAGAINNPELYVADIGISNSIWRKVGPKKHRGIDFGMDWVIKLRYQAAVE